MYVRIKRQKTTIFLHVEPTDTVLEVKQKLQELVQQASLPSSMKHICGTIVCLNYFEFRVQEHSVCTLAKLYSRMLGS